MKFKKLASLLVVAAMVFAMAVPAFASWAGTSDSGSSTTDSGSSTTDSGSSTTDSTSTEETSTSARSRSVQFTGTTKAPTINVDVATSMDIILNPYKLAVEVDGEENTQQLISSTLILTNQSDCDIDIAGTITATVEGEAKLLKTSDLTGTTPKLSGGTVKTATDKNVIIGMAMGNVGAEDAEITYASSIDSITDVEASTNTTAASKVACFDGFSSGTNDRKGWYLLDTSGTPKNFGDNKDVNTAASTDISNNATTKGNPYHLEKGNEEATYMAFRVFGAASEVVKEAWAATDTVSVAMTLTITPQVRTAS